MPPPLQICPRARATDDSPHQGLLSSLTHTRSLSLTLSLILCSWLLLLHLALSMITLLSVDHGVLLPQSRWKSIRDPELSNFAENSRLHSKNCLKLEFALKKLPKTRESCLKLQNLPKTFCEATFPLPAGQPWPPALVPLPRGLCLEVTLECFLAKGDLRYGGLLSSTSGSTARRIRRER